MSFNAVIGQEEVKAILRKQVDEKRIPHALMFSGPEGCGKLAMAVAFAKYVLCQHPENGDSCGHCPSCRQMAKYAHPDLHFSFPIIKKGQTTTCNDYLREWTSFLSSSLYFDFEDWLDAMGGANKQAYSLEAEGDNIINQMSLSSYEGGYKVMIVWLPEKMRGEAANNLLKTLEEPVPGAIFILVSNDTSTILPTILSRVQNIAFHALPAEVIAEALVQRNGLEQNTAMQIARISCGSYLKALKTISVNNEADTYFKNFTQLMRLAYSRNLVALKGWCDEVASWSREKQKSFLEYCQNMLRENFVYNFHRPELNFMNEQELQFATKFSSFINERNIVEFAHEFSVAQRDIEQNVYSRNVLFNMALQCIILIRK
jgi:DNA polymerase-3 subunit delta'